MNKITGKQLGSMLLISDAFALFSLTGGISLTTVAGLGAGTLLQFVLILPLLWHCGAQSRAEKLLYSAYFIFWGGMLFNMQWNTSRQIYIPYENSGGIWGKLLISGMISLVCLYISSVGIKAAARASLIAAVVGGACLLLVVISAVKNSDFENLKLAESSRSFSSELLRGTALSGGLGGMAVLTQITTGNRCKSAYVYLICKLVLTLAVTLTAVLVAGGIMEITDFPIVEAAQLTQPFAVQRIDSLFLIIFAIYAVFSIAIQAASAAYLIEELYPKTRKYAGGTALGLMILAGFLLSKTPRYGIFTAGAVIAAVAAVPLAAEVCSRFAGSKNC